jgi:hypothetical protein
VSDPETVRGWIDKAQADLERLVVEAERVQTEVTEARRRLFLLYELLASLTNSPVSLPMDNLADLRPVREQVRQNAFEVLREHSLPMRIQDIHREFVRKGMQLPGRGTPTNIIAHLSGDARFKRLGRGVYTLNTAPPEEHLGQTNDVQAVSRRKTRASRRT